MHSSGVFDASWSNESAVLQFSINDLHLMQNWSARTFKTVRLGKDRKDIWHEIIPGIALNHHFLMHGILAFSALHLAYLYPDQSSTFIMRATLHHTVAITTFREQLMNMSRDNCLAAFAFSSLLSLYSFASLKSSNIAMLTEGNEIVEWFTLAKGVYSATKDHLGDILNSPLYPLLSIDVQSFASPGKTGDNEVDKHIDSLYWLAETEEVDHQLLRDPAPGYPLTTLAFDSPDYNPESILETYKFSVRHLQRCFYTAYRRRDKMCEVSNVLLWAAIVPRSFVDLIAQRQPKALVIVAYYCVLLNQLEDSWWMEGCAHSLLRFIDDCLPEQWKYWLAWPKHWTGYRLDQDSLSRTPYSPTSSSSS